MIIGWGNFDELNGAFGFEVCEGNTNGGMVAVKYYRDDDPKIAGVGSIQYDGYDMHETKPVTPNKDSHVLTDAVIEDLARKCIEGKYGNYPLRKQLINSLGYGPIYSKVQTRVNMIIYGR